MIILYIKLKLLTVQKIAALFVRFFLRKNKTEEFIETDAYLIGQLQEPLTTCLREKHIAYHQILSEFVKK